MLLRILFLGLGLVMFVMFLYNRVQHRRNRALVFKLITSVSFIFISAVGVYDNQGRIIVLCILIGQFFGLLGDVFLEQKFMVPKSDVMYTRLGFITFGVGHLMFLVGMISHYNIKTSEYLFLLVGTVLIFMLVSLGEKPMKLCYGVQSIYVKVYTIIIGLVMLLSILTVIKTSFQQISTILFCLGMITFFLSDLVLSQTYFGKGKETPPFIIINHVLYYSAQFLISFSVMGSFVK